MPDPELAPLVIPASVLRHLQENLPELPDAKRERLEACYGLSTRDASILVKLDEGETGMDPNDSAIGLSGSAYFEELAQIVRPEDAANWTIHDLLGNLTRNNLTFANCPIRPTDLANLIQAVKERRITSRSLAK